MKTILQLAFCALVLAGVMFLNTSYTQHGYRYDYVPVFMEKSDLERSVSFQTNGRDMAMPGKIYYKAPYIYINEKYKGVHVINNTNPSQPVSEGFIFAPGCIDMAVKDNIMYLDNSIDLIAFDLNTRKVTERIKNVFPEPNSPNNANYPIIYRPEGFVLVGWKENN